MTARASDRDDECPVCGWRAANGCDCDDDGEALEAGYERLSEGEDGRQRTRGCVVIELLAAIASLLLIAVSFALNVERVEFHAGVVENVRADGWFVVGRQAVDPDRGEPPHGKLVGRVHCTNGLVAVMRDYRTVACARAPR